MSEVMHVVRKASVAATLAVALLVAMAVAPPVAESPPAAVNPVPPPPAPVRFMRAFVVRVNPSLAVEDFACAEGLPGAIYRYAQEHALDWERLLALAWQESDFDCHAKNRRDPGGAYGPFQIRRLWEPVIGDPRPRYYDPDQAVARVVGVIKYYQDTQRYQSLVERRFRNPLLCLYNTGETLAVNMPYCRQVGRKLEAVRAAWAEFVAIESQPAGRT